MRAWLVNQFYPPDVAPTGQLLHDLARSLRDRGHQVHVLCSRGAYGVEQRFPAWQEVDGIGVHRVTTLGGARSGLPTRALDAVWSMSGLAARAILRLPSPDLILSLTSPPYVGLLAAALAGVRGARLAHWVMDVYPDALAASDVLPPRGVAWRILRGLARAQYRSARLVLCLGPYVERRLAPYVRPGTRLAWVPPWGPPAPADGPAPAVRTARGWGDGEVVFQYSGNFGRGHRFVEFLAAAERLGPTGPRWAFAGRGPRAPEVAAAVARLGARGRVEVLDYVAPDELGAHLQAADVHLASLDPEWAGLIVPSKVVAGLSLGRPVIFVGPEDSEAALWIRESEGGWVVPPGDVDALISAVASALDSVERIRRGQSARAYADERFGRKACCESICRLLEECVSPGPGTAP